MKRKAVLLGSSPVQDPCYKVDSDVALIKDLLMSVWGGGWLQEEIHDVKNLTKDEILDEIAWAKDADVGLIYFAGHGKILKGVKPWKETHVLGYDMNFISESELNPGTPWCLQIFDCCRGDEAQTLFEKYAAEKLSQREGKFESVIARRLYAIKIASCEKGLCRLYSASSGKSAATIPYTFTEILHSGVGKWVDSGCRGDISLKNIFEIIDFSSLGEQKPEYNGGRRLNHLPLAVSQ